MSAAITPLMYSQWRDAHGVSHIIHNSLTGDMGITAPNEPRSKKIYQYVVEVNESTNLFDESSESELEPDCESKTTTSVKCISSPKMGSDGVFGYGSNITNRNSTHPKPHNETSFTSARGTSHRSRSQSAHRETRNPIQPSSRSSSSTRSARPRIDTNFSETRSIEESAPHYIRPSSRSSTPIDSRTLSPLDERARSSLTNNGQAPRGIVAITRRTERVSSPQEQRKAFQFPLNSLNSMVEHVHSPLVTILSPVNEHFGNDTSQTKSVTVKEQGNKTEPTTFRTTGDNSAPPRALSPTDTTDLRSLRLESPVYVQSPTQAGLGLSTTGLMRSSSCATSLSELGTGCRVHSDDIHVGPASGARTSYTSRHRRTISDQDITSPPQSSQLSIWSPASIASTAATEQTAYSPELTRSAIIPEKDRRSSRLSLSESCGSPRYGSTTPSVTGSGSIYNEIKADYQYVAREISQAMIAEREQKSANNNNNKSWDFRGRARSAARGLGIRSSSDKENVPRGGGRRGSLEYYKPFDMEEDNELWW